MTVQIAGQCYACTKAEKNGSSARLYLADGSTVEFQGVNNWEAFTLEGGTWGQPEVTPQEQLRADVDFIAAMMGVMLV